MRRLQYRLSRRRSAFPAVAESADTARLATDLAPMLRPRLQARTEGVAIRFRLGNQTFAGGANRRVDAGWSIGLQGHAGVACAPVNITFYSTPHLAARMAEQLNAAITETERSGTPTCA